MTTTTTSRAEQLHQLGVAVEAALNDHYDLSEIAAFCDTSSSVRTSSIRTTASTGALMAPIPT